MFGEKRDKLAKVGFLLSLWDYDIFVVEFLSTAVGCLESGLCTEEENLLHDTKN